MNTLIIAFCLASAVAYSYAAVDIFLPEQKPAEFDNQEGCYLSSLNRVLPYDTPYYPENGVCERYTCHRSNETQRVTCGAYQVLENCTTTKNTELNYPDCCEVIVCPTTEAPTTTPTTTASTTTASTTTASTTSTPPQPEISSASAYASSQSGSPPVVQASATPGASATASAS